MLGELTLSTHGRCPRRAPLACEALEERLVPATVLVTTDTNGNGVADTVIDQGNFIQIVRDNGTFRNYQLGSGWTFVSTTPVDTDGLLGNELVFRLANGIFRFIHDTPAGKTKDYNIGPSTFLLTTSSLNAQAGADMVFQVPQGIRIINDNTKVVRSYNMTGPWALLAGAPASVDFDAESELVFTVPGGIRVINDSPGRNTFYTIAGPFSLIATGDFDGKTGPGNATATDMAFAVPAGLRIVHEANRTVSKFSSSTGFWNLATLGTGTTVATTTETDGIPGAELIFDTGGGKIVIVSDVTKRVTGYFVGSNYTLVTNPVDTDGKPGNELVIKVNGMVRILRNASRTAKTYNLGPTWTFLNADNVDAIAGQELRFQVGSKVLVIFDAKETVETQQ